MLNRIIYRPKDPFPAGGRAVESASAFAVCRWSVFVCKETFIIYELSRTCTEFVVRGKEDNLKIQRADGRKMLKDKPSNPIGSLQLNTS